MKQTLTVASLLLTLLLAACGDATPPEAASAPSQAEVPAANPPAPGWARYQNSQYQFQIDYPVELAAQPETPEGARFASADQGVQLTIAAKPASAPDVAALNKTRQAELGKDGVKLGESHAGTSWFMITGTQGDKQVFEQSFLRDGVVTTMRLDYPLAQAAVWQPRVAEILKTVIPGTVKAAK